MCFVRVWVRFLDCTCPALAGQACVCTYGDCVCLFNSIFFRSQVVGGEHRAQGTMDAESSKHPRARQAKHGPRTRACAHKPSNVFYGCCVLRDPTYELITAHVGVQICATSRSDLCALTQAPIDLHVALRVRLHMCACVCRHMYVDTYALHTSVAARFPKGVEKSEDRHNVDVERRVGRAFVGDER